MKQPYFSERKMKIGVFVRNPNTAGGIQVFSKELATNLNDGIEMVFISKLEIETESEHQKIRNTASFINLRFQLRSFDLILLHQFSIKYYLLALMSRKPIVVVTHIWDLERQDLRSTTLRKIKRKLMLNPNLHLVYVSNALRQKIGIPGNVILNRSTFVFNESESNIPTKDILFVGRFYAEKGIYVFLEMVKLIAENLNRPIIASMIGEGPELDGMNAFIKANRLENVVSILPWTSRQQLKDSYLEHKILIVPSLWDEPYGLVASEGLSLGLKVFCSNKPGLIEATLNNAHYFDPGNIELPTKLISRELNSTQTYRHVFTEGLELNFSKTVDEYCELFWRIVANLD